MQLTSPNPWRNTTADFEPQLWAVVDIAAVVRYVANAADNMTLRVIESIEEVVYTTTSFIYLLLS